MRPPEKFQTVTRFCAADQRYEGRKPEPRAYVQGLDVRTISGRRGDIFLDILFIECNQAFALKTGTMSVIAIFRQIATGEQLFRRAAGPISNPGTQFFKALCTSSTVTPPNGLHSVLERNLE